MVLVIEQPDLKANLAKYIIDANKGDKSKFDSCLGVLKNAIDKAKPRLHATNKFGYNNKGKNWTWQTKKTFGLNTPVENIVVLLKSMGSKIRHHWTYTQKTPETRVGIVTFTKVTVTILSFVSI